MSLRFLLFVMLVLSACSPLPGTVTLPPDSAVTSPPEDGAPTSEPVTNPLAPRSGDEQLRRDHAFVQEAGLLIRESYPPQIALTISGELPTPCHQLRVVVTSPDAENKIAADVYSVVNPDMMCTQVLKPFQEQIELGTFPSGHYSVSVNGELAGEFDS
jgi:hypothetical protein